MDIEASARKHGVSDDMLHALRHHWQAFESDKSRAARWRRGATASRPVSFARQTRRRFRVIAELVDRRAQVEDEILSAVRAARHANRSWSEIGAMLGVSKQAAQRKYSDTITL